MRIFTGAVRKLERQHRAETALLARRDGMAGMFGQARVVHRADRRMLVQQGNDRGGIFLVHAQARIQRAQATQGQEGIERWTRQAQRVAPPHQLLVHCRITRDHCPAHHIAVAVDVLRGGMQHQVRTERQRLLQRW